MRLLHTSRLCLEEFIGEHIPPYAILSHTWGRDEVTYNDLLQGKCNAKILGCCQLAASESWDYVWIDTCCIDKSSSAELSEAINSMYQWYQRSEICYAYLEDVTPQSTSMQHCRWFTRGWTLQELLAPSRVVFVDQKWRLRGSKISLEKEISHITGIGGSQLRSHLQASVAAKMSWMSKRKTTRIEDVAYCLLGLFEVNIPLLYGEGERAFIRLQEEIIRHSDDQSIFAWADKTLEFSGMFARHPSAFAASGDIVTITKAQETSKLWKLPYRMTNKGLEIEFPLFDGYYEESDDYGKSTDGNVGQRFEVPLSCRRSTEEAKHIFVTLKVTSSGKASRVNLFHISSLSLPEVWRQQQGRTKTFLIGFDTSSLYVPDIKQLWNTSKVKLKLTEQAAEFFPYSRDASDSQEIQTYLGDYASARRNVHYDVFQSFGRISALDELRLSNGEIIIPAQDVSQRSRALFFGNESGDGLLVRWFQYANRIMTVFPPDVQIFIFEKLKSRTEPYIEGINLNFKKQDDVLRKHSNDQGHALFVQLRYEIEDGKRVLVIALYVYGMDDLMPIELPA